MAAITIHAMRGPRQSIEALTLLAFLLVVNKGLVNVGGYVSMFRWPILFAAFGRVIWDTIIKNAPVPRVLPLLMIFTLTIFLFALLVSFLPAVSILKVVTFSVGVGTILTCLHRTLYIRDYWLSWFTTIGLFILVASVPLYATPWGFMRNGVSFQGILVHPQIYGPIAATMTSFFTGLVFFESSRSRLMQLGVALGWLAIFTSQSRTSFLALFLSFLLVLIFGFMHKKWQPQIVQALSRSTTLLIGAFAIFFVVLQWGNMQNGLVTFLLKDDGDASSSITNALEDSRGWLIQRSMNNFYENPLTGIGFGVPSNPEAARVETGFLGLPTGASVEKGFMPSAVLEETGITGAFFVVLLLITLIRPVLQYGGISLFWMLMTCVMINAGEMVFFSVGGMGLYIWLLMAFCYTYAASVPLLSSNSIRA